MSPGNNWERHHAKRENTIGRSCLGGDGGRAVGGRPRRRARRRSARDDTHGLCVSLSGPYAPGAATTTVGNYDLWLHDVNEAGGIYLSKYDKKVPVEFIVYDDRSQLEEAVRLTERLMLEDEVDFVLPPWGTATHMAVGRLYERHGYPLLAFTCTVERSIDLSGKWKNVFWLLSPPSHLVGAIKDSIDALRAADKINDKVAIAYMTDQLGVEMATAATDLFTEAGYDIVYNKSYPPTTGGPVAAGQGDEATRARHLPRLQLSPRCDDAHRAIDGARLQSEVLLRGSGAAPSLFRRQVRRRQDRWLTGIGGIDPGLQSIQDYVARYRAVIGEEPDLTGGPVVYGSLEMLQQAIESVGELDREKVLAALRDTSFDTVAGNLEIKDQMLVGYWRLGQWQGGEWVGLEPSSRDGARPVLFPKPTW